MNRIKQKLNFIKDNLSHPSRLINYFGLKYVNPQLKQKMIFQPASIDIEPTTKCNLKCIFCPVPTWSRSKLKNMTISEFKTIIDKFPYLINIKLQGMGEPFLNKDIFKMITYVNKKDIKITINTNGTTLDNEKIHKLFKNPPDLISFSLDTNNKKKYIAIRGKDKFDILINNIKESIKERDKTKSNTKINLWCVLNKKNLDELNEIIKLAIRLKVDKLTIQTKLSGFGIKEMNKKNKELSISLDKKINNIFDEYTNYAKNNNLDFSIFYDNQLSINNPCKWLHRSLYISVEGEIVPCCIIANPQTISLGNIHKVKKFSKIWNNKKYQQLRKMLQTGKLPQFCKNCYETQ